VSVFLSLVIGMPIGILCARNDRVSRFMAVINDTIQTLPTFVYLIPIIMIMGTGEFPAVIAIVVYAITAAIRFTDHAIRNVSPTLVEAALMSGANRWQVFVLAEVPAARSGLLLAINQTVMMAFGVLVITALIGSR